MAKYNEILVGRFNNALKKAFGMKGPAPSPQLASEVAATVSLFYGKEHRFLEEWHIFGFNQNVVLVAAKVALLQIRNPASSNVVCVFEKIKFNGNGSAADGFVYSQGAKTADLTTLLPGTNIRFDPRHPPNSSMVISSDNLAVPVDLQVRDAFNLPVNTNLDVIATDIQEVVLLPGDAALFRNTTLAQNLSITLWWRERFLEESERQ
jgi:hypothetical protein